MVRLLAAILVAMFLFQTARAADNPWKDKAGDAVKRAELHHTVPVLEEAFDTVFRADDWQAGQKLVELAQRYHPDEPKLRGHVARMLWRAGRLEDAEKIADQIPVDQADAAGLHIIVETSLGRGLVDRAAAAGARLETLKPPTALNLMEAIAARTAIDKLDGVAELFAHAEQLADAKNGHPEIYYADEIGGLAEFFKLAGTEPLNRVTYYGSAAMTRTPLIGLPRCRVTVNGHGPYNMILDTGGSIVISLDKEVAGEIELPLAAEAVIRGVAGKDTSHQAIIDEITIGGITCEHVMARVFDVRKAAAFSCDGIIGTGVFADGRMTMDFANELLTVEPSSEKPARGDAVPLRIVADAKLIAPVTVDDQAVTAILDSGADVVALAPSFMRRLNPGKRLMTVDTGSLGGTSMGIGAGDGPEITIGPGSTIEIGGRVFRGMGGIGIDVLDNIFGPLLGLQADILIGMPMFRDMKAVTVDFPRCQMWADWLPQE
ncbi:MAG: aspartyl protease family protein [Phycisphaerae bacterium]|nr:aspartyl protease family protein [Phycisphaerae bacterium]